MDTLHAPLTSIAGRCHKIVGIIIIPKRDEDGIFDANSNGKYHVEKVLRNITVKPSVIGDTGRVRHSRCHCRIGEFLLEGENSGCA